MKRIFVLMTLACFFSLQGVTNQELFLQANNSFKAGDYEKSLNLYQLVTNKGWAVWYNMGNCWFALENYSQAILSWHKAEKECDAAFAKIIKENLCQAYEKLGIVDEAINPAFSINTLPFIILQLLFLAFLLLCGLCLPLLLRNKRFYMLGCIMSLLVISGGTVGYSYHQQSMQQGIVMKSFELTSGTDHNFSRCGNISEGALVTIVSNQGEWYKIKNKNQVGWIPYDCVELI